MLSIIWNTDWGVCCTPGLAISLGGISFVLGPWFLQFWWGETDDEEDLE